MNKNTPWLLLALILLFPLVGLAEIPADWKQVTHGGLVFSIPADWAALREREFEGQWGIKNKEERQAIGVNLTRERHPEKTLKRAEKDGMTVTSLGDVKVGELSANQHQISGQIEELDAFLRVIIVEGLLPDGDKISLSASVVGMPVDQWTPVIEKVMSSISATPELVSTLQGYSRHDLFDGLFSLEVRNNWEMTDHSDNVSWEPPLLSLYGARLIRFAHGYHLTGSNGMLSKMKEPVLEKSEMFGIPAWRISATGIGTTYATPMRKKTIPATTVLYLSDICLAKGDRFGYAITGTDEQLSEHKEALEQLLNSVRLTLPEQAGPCDELIAYEWSQGMQIEVPRSWRKNQDTRYQLSWYDRSLTTGADIRASIIHNTTNVHPIKGYEHPSEVLEQLTIDGYPATHYRKRHTGSDKVETLYDYYILDTRMRFGATSQQNTPSFFYLQFATKPAALAEPDTALHRRVMETIAFGPEWESETPVVRTKAPVAASLPEKVDQPAVSTGVSTGTAGKKGLAPEVASAIGGKAVGSEAEGQNQRTEVAGESAPLESDQAATAIKPTLAVDLPDTPERPAREEPVHNPGQVENEVTLPGAYRADTRIPPDVDAEPENAAVIDARQRYQKASTLRSEGAALQEQGKLREAVEKYRHSLTFYPDDRLEAHVQLLEKVLAGGK
ncbi:MAG: hypothetical protein OQL28_02775 [Sedimenticola sp.]|nr:hypothetical protein [Sedimenticola sp.]